jgi:hypothetical protein
MHPRIKFIGSDNYYMIFCGREQCVYKAVQQMIDRMKDDLTKRQSIAYPEQIVVAKIYDITAAILSEACRRNFCVDRKDCEPSNGFEEKQLTMDTFILLNQLKEDGFVTEEQAKLIFESLVKIKPDIERIARASGF